jgi:hypothetical protein
MKNSSSNNNQAINRKNKSNMFFFRNLESSLIEFERLKKMVNNRLDGEVLALIQKMLVEIEDKSAIDRLSQKYPEHFANADDNWYMDHEIAIKVLEYELNHRSGRYSFEIVHYLFSYFMSSLELRPSYFLMHGYPIDLRVTDLTAIESLDKSDYIISSLEEDRYENYILNCDELDRALLGDLKFYERRGVHAEKTVCILQVVKSY